jgi:hypothetical protein
MNKEVNIVSYLIRKLFIVSEYAVPRAGVVQPGKKSFQKQSEPAVLLVFV